MKTLKDLNLTELETRFMESFIGELYAEPGFSDVGLEDMAGMLKVNINVIKGVVGSLVKKGIIWIGEKEWLGSDCDIIYLVRDYQYLHPEWSKEL
jgi:hypothetical protein